MPLFMDGVQLPEGQSRFEEAAYFLPLTKIKQQNCLKKTLLNTTINLPSYIFRLHTLILLASFFIYFVVNFCQLYEQGKVNILFMFHFLETDIREQKKYEMRTQTSVDNTVNDLPYEIKFESCAKIKNNFFIKRNIAFLS